ncbi:MAG: hypothetical protein ABI863_13790 [Ginsengibacter sp.]
MRSLFLHIYLVLVVTGFMVSPFCSQQTFSQPVKTTEIQNGDATNNQLSLQEKIYVHTDRSLYLCGEVLWFKTYVINAATNQPVSISKVVYIEVLNKLYQPVLRAKIAMKNGMGNGSLYLPFSIASGNYVVRAYTNWMKNFSQENYFEKNISIVNTSISIDSSAIHEPVNYMADFFPEGGNLVNGLESKVAFKVTDNRNKGTECEGVIVNQFKDTVVHFKSHVFGMGYFYLKPENGNHYTAIITFKNGSSIRKDLPEVYAAGYVIHVADTGLNDLKISISAKGLNENISPVIYIIIQNNRHIDFAKFQSLEHNETVLSINKDSLKYGVSQITVFNADKQPVCERLYFRRPKNKMLITVKQDNENCKPRSKVMIDVSTTDQTNTSLPGNLSAAVYRLDNLHKPDRENIFSYLWLSSNLYGNIENPDYYFRNENTETNEALDNLLLVQGWRKFSPDNTAKNKPPVFSYVPEFAGHIITGKLTNEATKKPVADVLVYLSVPGKHIQLHGCTSDSAGWVHFEMKDFFGVNQIVVQTNDDLDSTYHLEIFSPFSEKFSGNLFPAFDISEIYGDDLLAGNIQMEVQNAYHENQLQQFIPPLVDTIPFYFKPYKTYLLDDYTRFTTMEEVMREYVDEVDVRRSGTKFRFMTLNAPVSDLHSIQPADPLFPDNPLVLLDGVPVFNIDKIIAYDPLKVQKLEVVAEKYHFGKISAEGIVSYTTYKGTLEGFALNPHDLVLDYEGLQQQRIFYSPEYATEDERVNRLPDFRNLLFWTPQLNTGSNGKGSFSFYTGDIPGKYLVVVQGLAPNGCAGANSFILNVGN